MILIKKKEPDLDLGDLSETTTSKPPSKILKATPYWPKVREVIERVKTEQSSAIIPKLTDEILNKIFDSPKAQQVLAEINNGRFSLLRVTIEGILRYKADEKYCQDCWGVGGGLKVEEIKSMFNWKGRDKQLDDRECLQFYNDFLVPLWNYSIKEFPRSLALSCEEVVIVKKSELAMLMWLVTKCQSLDILNFGICPTPKVRSRG